MPQEAEKQNNEEKFKETLKEKIQEQLGKDESGNGLKLKVETNKNLIYKVIVNKSFKYEPDDIKAPKRGNYAFQTDLLITNDEDFPLVVIETKYENFSTHDILVYSTKAQRHKEIYPYLRYGLVVGKSSKIENRFFTHNIGFDFAYALEDLNDDASIKKLVKIIQQQIKVSKSLLEIIINKKSVKSVCIEVIIDYEDNNK